MTCTIDLDRDGRQEGVLTIPRSTNSSAWAQLHVPIVSVKNGDGPGVFVSGGTHGDEPEGQILALNLAARLRPEAVSGQVIIIPCLSMEASAAGTRLWPGGANLNRSFPGSPDGTEDEQLAHFVSTEVFGRVEVVVDIHSGGRSMRLHPMGNMHMVPDLAQRAAMLDHLLAWNLDFLMVYLDVAGTGLLAGEAERQGKIVADPELGGGGLADRGATLGPGHRGLANVLRHAGVLGGEVETRQSLGLPPTTILAALHEENYIFAPESGLFEALVDPGDEVAAGQPVANLYRREAPGRPPLTVATPVEGVVCGVRSLYNTGAGECLALIGQKADRDLVMRGA